MNRYKFNFNNITVYNFSGFKYKLILFFAAYSVCIFSTTNIEAQKIDPTVKVSRDFDSNADNIHKSKLPTTLPDSIYDFNLNFDYTIFDKKYNNLYEFVPLQSAIFTPNPRNDTYTFQAKLGYMSSFSPDLYVKYYPKLKNGLRLGFDVAHSSFWGKLPLVGFENRKSKRYDIYKVSAYDRNTSGTVELGYSWTDKELNFTAKYSSGYYSYYGADAGIIMSFSNPDYLDSLKTDKYVKNNRSRKFDLIEAGINFRSIKERGMRRRFNYLFDIYYSSIKDKTSLFPITGKIINQDNGQYLNGINVKEHYFNITGKFGPAVGRYADLLFGVNIDFHNSIDYATTNYDPKYPFNKNQYCDFMNFSIEYKIQKNKWNMFLKGIASIKSTSFENSNKYYTPFFFNADFTFEVVKGNLWWYGNIGGNNTTNGYSNLFAMNKWINPFIDMKVTSIPFSFRTGLKGTDANRLSYEAHIKYIVHKGLLQFVNYTGNYYAYKDILGASFNTAYSNHREFSAGAKLKWSSQSFTAGLDAEYRTFTKGRKGRMFGNYSFSGNTPWGYAPFEGAIYGEYNYNKKIYAGLRVIYRSETKSAPLNIVLSDNEFDASKDETTITGFANLCLDIKYVVDKNFTLFLSGSNLFNSPIQYYPQYLEKGIQIGGGLLVKF